jgi:VIT1/CCC1 family predicted Fe2+/Mn2+ transporter
MKKIKKIKNALKAGLSFGLTSAVITTLGLMVGLYSGTGSRLAVLGGVLTIAIADSFADALGIHVSEESRNGTSILEIWGATIAALISKFSFALLFIIPIVFLDLQTAIWTSGIVGIILLIIISIAIAKTKGDNPYKAATEHVTIAILVILMTHYVGKFISTVVID